MAIIRWDPSGDACRLEDRITEMFDEAFPCLRSGEPSTDCDWQPAVDVYPMDRRIVISVDLPGMTKEDVFVDWSHGVLTIRGSRKPTAPAPGGRYFRRERHFGGFSRSFFFREAVSTEGILAVFANGVLNIEVPLSEEERTRKIAVSVDTP
jgi:HSP20 family protein